MDKKDINFLEELLYKTDKDSTISLVRNIDDPLMLHVFAANYNWNSGFDVPRAILENENCDFGTGLLMFHYADGYRMLENQDDVSTSTLEEWKDFLFKTYNKLINLKFKTQNISFDPELTKIQKFKLKKSNPNIPDILLDKSPGHVVDVPKI
ncbi:MULTISPECIES: DUF4274 domain-containing protein [unclassified Bacillus (in: firmicutes)]|uniref:DUF4274 domain-containing protein n=1 Tax=unclassified Bacillus (in: firmicutes) TaxID=185979 RepID=UPI0004093ED4|nr:MULTISPECIES: DUF4274 domain-containing protein [unclassified Bacillus (in: firmicutes)]QHZ47242.1 DUF4274 domain-containing protein [Bacillus sp. NSP9.1]WFA03303.1 DUF4274 domain-containing protein [Bacillus sp. HSf4]